MLPDRRDTSTQETAAVACIRVIHIAQTQYFSQFNHYASSLKELGPPEHGVATAQAADIIDAALASGTKNGYGFVTLGNQTGYTVNAEPLVFEFVKPSVRSYK